MTKKIVTVTLFGVLSLLLPLLEADELRATRLLGPNKPVDDVTFGGVSVRSAVNSIAESIVPVDRRTISVLFDTSGIDREFQTELLTAVQLAFRHLNENDVRVSYIDVGKIAQDTVPPLLTCARWIRGNGTYTAVSLLQPEALNIFSEFYENLSKSSSGNEAKLAIFSPRRVQKILPALKSVTTYSLQMSDMALAVALLNRVEKVGVTTLIPVLDKGNAIQLELLADFVTAGQHRLQPIEIAPPIFVVSGDRSHALRLALTDNLNSSSTRGILILATYGSRTVIEEAREGTNMMQMRWFSPYLTNYEEWATTDTQATDDGRAAGKQSNATFGIYSVSYVGARGWDNPSRRKTLRELGTTLTRGTNPRILCSILAYDAAWMARNYCLNDRRMLTSPMQGLSGEIVFDENGHRMEGLFFGVSAVPDLATPWVSLLQPSKWILEDILNMVETMEGQYLITEYHVATSSMLTKDELLRFSSSKGNSSTCQNHAMEVITHDPFNQMKAVYMFTSDSLPQYLLIPNQHGYGITFSCQENHKRRVTLKIACTAGIRFSDPVKCFRSHLPVRKKRWTQGQQRYSAYYAPHAREYPYRPVQSQSQRHFDSTFSRRDDSNQYYYGSPGNSIYDSATLSSLTTRLDIPIVSEDVTSTTQSPFGGPKVPELRQILKAAKPFVGSCVGSATGCAMCVLVLGRLPLGTLPPACTGPCFVGTFGSCGSLLGRAFSETTVICTELFRQGYIDVDTFLADAEFGRLMKSQNPTIYQGYHFLATPLVEGMRRSELVTKIVAKFAVPWAEHMKSRLGYSDSDNFLGFLIHFVGNQLCLVVGLIHQCFFSQTFTSVAQHAHFSAAALITFVCLVSATLFSKAKGGRRY